MNYLMNIAMYDALHPFRRQKGFVYMGAWAYAIHNARLVRVPRVSLPSPSPPSRFFSILISTISPPPLPMDSTTVLIPREEPAQTSLSSANPNRTVCSLVERAKARAHCR